MTLTGEYRDVAEENVFFYDGPLLTGIEHPYWTPQGYFAGDLTLQWRHDLSALKFCGARQHVYLLKLGVGTDTDSNAGVKLAGEYRFDFAPRWSINAEAFIERSEQWDAEGLWLNLTHRF